MSVDSDTPISSKNLEKRRMDVVSNMPIGKGLEEPRVSTRLDMSSPFQRVTKKESDLPDPEHQSEVLIARETCAQ